MTARNVRVRTALIPMCALKISMYLASRMAGCRCASSGTFSYGSGISQETSIRGSQTYRPKSADNCLSQLLHQSSSPQAINHQHSPENTPGYSLQVSEGPHDSYTYLSHFPLHRVNGDMFG
jgi:hypothetical protein